MTIFIKAKWVGGRGILIYLSDPITELNPESLLDTRAPLEYPTDTVNYYPYSAMIVRVYTGTFVIFVVDPLIMVTPLFSHHRGRVNGGENECESRKQKKKNKNTWQNRLRFTKEKKIFKNRTARNRIRFLKIKKFPYGIRRTKYFCRSSKAFENLTS